MPDLKITTEVAGRVCELAAEAGTRVGEGEEIVVVKR